MSGCLLAEDLAGGMVAGGSRTGGDDGGDVVGDDKEELRVGSCDQWRINPKP